uniref:Uncharacterized protein n=1 Tax=Solanum lycopersicum TaxID=4081 RepID=K4AUN3_SOLLC
MHKDEVLYSSDYIGLESYNPYKNKFLSLQTLSPTPPYYPHVQQSKYANYYQGNKTSSYYHLIEVAECQRNNSACPEKEVDYHSNKFFLFS